LQDSVDYLLNQANDLVESNPAVAFSKAAIANRSALNTGWGEKRAIACKFMGEAKMQLEDYYQAKKYLCDALEYYRSQPSANTADLYFLLGKTNNYLENTRKLTPITGKLLHTSRK
jgi:hypothetical protein